MIAEPRGTGVQAGPGKTPPETPDVKSSDTHGPATDNGAASDEALMSAYAAGDADAFDALYGRHRGASYRYFLRQLPEDQAADCFQSLWEKLIRSRERYQPSAPFRAYLFAIARNVLMDQHRANGRRPASAEEDADAFVDPASETDGVPTGVAREELAARLKALVAALPFHQRESWLLLKESQLSHQQIAALTGATEEGVKSRIRYARAKLKAGLTAYVQASR